ncbi:hypothetical protein QYM36_002742 [Artemia franciscana]|uniref:BZIP domain-containing protein n=1 Tax=Artemia franciscana TaxID=6661 RepID=A0AA88IK63_ARTSF|nr:hypothetical protein QYM36_002742 [Artemia franciscana]
MDITSDFKVSSQKAKTGFDDLLVDCKLRSSIKRGNEYDMNRAKSQKRYSSQAAMDLEAKAELYSTVHYDTDFQAGADSTSKTITCKDLKIVNSKGCKPLIRREPFDSQSATEVQTETSYSQVDVQESEKESLRGKVNSRSRDKNMISLESLDNNDASRSSLRKQSRKAKISQVTGEMFEDKEKRTMKNEDYEPDTKLKVKQRDEDKEPARTMADNMLSSGIQNFASKVEGDTDEISSETLLLEKTHQKHQRHQPMEDNEGKKVKNNVVGYGLCTSQENAEDNGGSETFSNVNNFQSPEACHSFSTDSTASIESHTPKKNKGLGQQRTWRTKNALKVEKRNQSKNIQALLSETKGKRERNKEAARAYRKRIKDYILGLERLVTSNVGLPAKYLRTKLARGNTIDMLRKRESFQSEKNSGGEIQEPLNLSTKSQAGGSSKSNTLPFEKVKTNIAEQNSISALKQSTKNFGIMRAKNDERKNDGCFERHEDINNCLNKRKKDAIPKEDTGIASRRNARIKKIKIEELETHIVTLEERIATLEKVQGGEIAMRNSKKP